MIKDRPARLREGAPLKIQLNAEEAPYLSTTSTRENFEPGDFEMLIDSLKPLLYTTGMPEVKPDLFLTLLTKK